MYFKDVKSTCLYLGKKIPTVYVEERALIPLVRYQIYYNKKKHKYCSKNYWNNKIMRITTPAIIPLLNESNVHFPL
jgi:hypothetical protein